MHKELKQLREEENVSQAFMALELGVSRPTYIAIEQGKRELTFNELLRVSKFFKSDIIIRPEYWVLKVSEKPAREFKGDNKR